MRVVKGIICILVAGIVGGAVFGDALVDIAMLFSAFSWKLVAWAWAVAGVICGGLAGAVYFHTPDEKSA